MKMVAPWSLIGKVLGTKAAEPVAATPVPAEPPKVEDVGRHLLGKGPLDDVGQQSEHVRERIGHLSVRLDDLKSLADDFGQIVQPLNDFVVQHVQTKSRLLEVEALLSREREYTLAARNELSDLRASASVTAGDLAAATAELRRKEDALRQQEGNIAQLRLRLDDMNAQAENLEKQLAGETERARALTEDNQALRIEIESLEQFRARAENEVNEARQHVSLTNAENERLQHLADGLAQRMNVLKGQILDLEPQIQAGRQEISVLQIKLSTEQAVRQKIETNREVERSAQENEISSLTMKIEGLNAHIATTDRILGNIKDQLRERSDALRISEKSLKEALAEKTAAERRVETVQEAASRQAAQMSEFQRLNAELKDRCEMLTKALSAKEALLENGARKASSLAARIEQLNARFEQDRAAFEATNRRLIEEVQSERAERSLAQGALDIARNSRSKLLAQYTALKRQQSSVGTRGNDLPDDDQHVRLEGMDNVRVLKGSDRVE